MPSHPDRVRRSYHTITVKTTEDHQTDDLVITTRIRRVQWVTAMSRREVDAAILRFWRLGIMEAKELGL